jgi:AcrR family transcriptional regulator
MQSDMNATVETTALELPVIGSPRERADAALNREKVLAAAERLFAERGVESVTMECVAETAGVGKGTVFRRFGDRTGLILAVRGERERRFQEAAIRGGPPLGPGAPAIERLIAFGSEYLRTLERDLELVMAAEAAPSARRLRGAVYEFYRTHLTLLAREARPDADAEYIADALLATLTGEVVWYQLRLREMPRERIAAGFAALVRGLLSCPA